MDSGEALLSQAVACTSCCGCGGGGTSAGEWARLLLTLPLELSAIGAKTEAHWLQRRNRSSWWRSNRFPKVPGDSLASIEANLPEPTSVWQKLVPLAVIFFCAGFNLTLIQNASHSLMVTSAGAEVLPFLASCGVLPASLAFFFFYGRLVELLPPAQIFYAAIAPLVAFYVAFAAVLYPAAPVLHPTGLAAALGPHLPVGFAGLLKMVEYWTYALFFCVAELWGPIVISVLFWTLANEVCTVQDARTIYPLMGIAANIALVVAGIFIKHVTAAVPQAGAALRVLMGAVLVLTGVMVATKAYMDRRVAVAARIAPPKAAPGSKRRGGLAESWATLRASPMIASLVMLVVAYSVSHRLFEFAWKGQLRMLFPSALAYQSVLADVSIATGYATIGLMLAGRLVFQFLGWGVAAATTPVVMAVTGGAFFAFSLFGSADTATLGVYAGAVTQVFARSSKFSLFDPAKEMVYIEMPAEEKRKGKAAVDLVGSQVGKSGASWIAQALLLALGSIAAALPIIAAIFGGVIAAWLAAVRHLNAQMEERERLARSSIAQSVTANGTGEAH
ncbi:hypothetical protein WJX81_002274 [Elliptochloris bilobata]|uniref:ADP,ATP carrier protein n=1 Tax=Elliptochloris bilobata TaxID=381761 RepID=A0AAW1RG95_9CHLO